MVILSVTHEVGLLNVSLADDATDDSARSPCISIKYTSRYGWRRTYMCHRDPRGTIFSRK